MRRTSDDVMARAAAESKVADFWDEQEADDNSTDVAKSLIGTFKAVEFETTTRKVGDEEIPLRRLVITGPWEVAPGSR